MIAATCLVGVVEFVTAYSFNIEQLKQVSVFVVVTAVFAIPSVKLPSVPKFNDLDIVHQKCAYDHM